MNHRQFEKLESNVRSYCRSFTSVFTKAEGSILYDDSGKEYIDFFSGAGALNYGHNHPEISAALIKYIQSNGITHSLDLATEAKEAFLQAFNEIILAPRDLDYKIQFTGPTGTNAVEAALKLARMVKKRSGVVAFTGAYHGHTLGSLSVTANRYYKDPYFSSAANVTFLPFDQYLGPELNTLNILRKYLEDTHSGMELPAAIILETIQAEGGINVANSAWLKELESICNEFDILLIIDDIQVGNGRTGEFFSFEESGITPDIVCMSKSLGGGLPLALNLIKPELDAWKPGQHTGTFRGNNLAFVCGAAAIQFWKKDTFLNVARENAVTLEKELKRIQEKHTDLNMLIRGRGLILGLDIPKPDFAANVSQIAFEKGLLLECAGSNQSVLKFLPALNIHQDNLLRGLSIVDLAIEKALKNANKL